MTKKDDRVVMCVKVKDIGMVDHYVKPLKGGKVKIIGPVSEIDAEDAKKAAQDKKKRKED